MNSPEPVVTSAVAGGAPAPLTRFLVTLIALYLIGFMAAAAVGAYAMWPAEPARQALPAAADGTFLPSQLPAQPVLVGRAGSREHAIMLLVCYLGIVGSCIHAMTSLATYVGNKTFHLSWTLWYLLRPMIGGALAWVAYLVFRGGFLGQEPGAVLNPFAFGALGALAGLFSKRVVDKMSELVDVMLRMPPGKGDDARASKPIAQELHITRIEPARLSRGQPVTTLTISGAGFLPGAVVEVGDMILVPTALRPDRLRVDLPVKAYADRDTVTLAVQLGGPAGAKSNAVSLCVIA